MQRPGTDPNNVQMTDILCDFCMRPWNDEEVFIEGHQGSVVCGKCLRTAYIEVIGQESNTAPDGYKCTMCLEHRDDPAWQSPMNEEAVICKRCIDLASEAIDKDADSDWKRPV